jgi:plastocyanin
MNHQDARGRLAVTGMLWAAGLLACLASAASAATLTVKVLDRDGLPVTGVVVHATPLGRESPKRDPHATPVMDQREEQFTPHILVVQTGTAVLFPNHDAVSHHVYSFSRPKPFELPLYKGMAYPPIVFDQPGIVDLGCNIHDSMEAHVVVIDTPHFAMTSADGAVELTGLPAGEYAVEIYTPRLRASLLPAPIDVTLHGESGADLQFRFEKRLGPPHTDTSESLTWSHY